MISREIQKVPEGKNALSVFLRKILRDHYQDLLDIYKGEAEVEGKLHIVTLTDETDWITTWDKRFFLVGASGDTGAVSISYNQDTDCGLIMVLSPNVAWRDLLLSPHGGNVGVATESVTADAKLDVAGTNGAFMPPRLTTTQRDALTPSEGMMIYNTTTKQFEGYEDDAWVDL